MEELYSQYSRMIYQAAHRTARKWPSITVDELVSEGNLIFLKAAESHQEDKASFSTWLYRKLQLDLNCYAKRLFFKRGREQAELPEVAATEAQETGADLKALFSADAQGGSRHSLNCAGSAHKGHTAGNFD